VLAEDVGVDGTGCNEGAVMCGLEGGTGLEEEVEVGLESAAACDVFFGWVNKKVNEDRDVPMKVKREL
jgi:hypothetical protein